MANKNNRNWAIYNEKLVKRGEFYLSFDLLESWSKELVRMNRKKRGRPFEYPTCFVKFSALISMFFDLPYRQLEGVLRKLEICIPKLKAADYTTLWYRIPSLKLDFPEHSDEPVVVAVDSTGIKVTNRGEWLRKNWKDKERKGWIKVHIGVDVKTKELVALEVTDEKTADCEMFKPLLKDLNLKDVLADGAYDNEYSFKFLLKKGVKMPGIKIRENASRKGLSDRAFAVREFQRLGYEKWKRKHKYGKRWSAEGFFSVIKRCFGETVRATSVMGAIIEVRRKFMFYNILLGL